MNTDFPFRFDAQGRTAVAEGDRYVRCLVEQLLFTMPGERVMRPTFGSGLAQLVFQPAGDELATAVQFLVQGGLQQWLGDLITVEDVTVDVGEAVLDVRVQYVVRRTAERRVEQLSRPL